MENPVKRDTEKISVNKLLSFDRLTYFEQKLGTGELYFPIFACLFMLNGIIYSVRFNYSTNKSAFFYTLIGSLALAKGCSYLFRDKMYAQAIKVYKHSKASSKFWEETQNKENKI